MSKGGTALLSVYDKDGLQEFAAELKSLGWDLWGSRGTASYLNERNISTRDVAELVGDPILGHRVVTISREIHAALLATDSPEDKAELKELGIPRIDLVYCNFYPLEEEIAKPDATPASVREKTDIGGPTMLRSAAKGCRLAVYRAKDLNSVISHIRAGCPASVHEMMVSQLASIAELAVSNYCLASSNFHSTFSGRD